MENAHTSIKFTFLIKTTSINDFLRHHLHALGPSNPLALSNERERFFHGFLFFVIVEFIDTHSRCNPLQHFIIFLCRASVKK